MTDKKFSGFFRAAPPGYLLFLLEMKIANLVMDMRENFRRRMAAVKFAQQPGDGLDDERIGIAGEVTASVAELRRQPQFGEAAGNQVGIHTLVHCKGRTLPGLFNQMRKAVLSVLQRGEFSSELKLFFREAHGAETISINVGRWLSGFRRTCLFLPRGMFV